MALPSPRGPAQTAAPGLGVTPLARPARPASVSVELSTRWHAGFLSSAPNGRRSGKNPSRHHARAALAARGPPRDVSRVRPTAAARRAAALSRRGRKRFEDANGHGSG